MPKNHCSCFYYYKILRFLLLIRKKRAEKRKENRSRCTRRYSSKPMPSRQKSCCFCILQREGCLLGALIARANRALSCRVVYGCSWKEGLKMPGPSWVCVEKTVHSTENGRHSFIHSFPPPARSWAQGHEEMQTPSEKESGFLVEEPLYGSRKHTEENLRILFKFAVVTQIKKKPKKQRVFLFFLNLSQSFSTAAAAKCSEDSWHQKH